MMQGLHHQQQQLGALFTVALAKEDSATTSVSTSSTDGSAVGAASTSCSITDSSASDEGDESNRLAAINSIHRLILYPPNSILVARSATFLCQGFYQLLSDKSYSVRKLAATAYGALCSVLCSIQLGPNGRQNHVVLGTLVDRFINWALPLLHNVTAADGSVELALEALREFLSVGDAGAIERFGFSILKACQELLEDERTSSSLLKQLLGILTMISLKFFRCFQPHFVDIVDLLLGWAMIPDIAEADRQVIMSSFLQFQNHWVSNLQFPLGLLQKFLGDMDVLLQDSSPGTPQQFQRLLALLSCYSTVLQSTALGLLELNHLEQIVEPLGKMIPQLLGCLCMIGKKFGWRRWIDDSWRCLTLLAEILGERFANFYTLAVDVLFQSLNMGDSTRPVGAAKVTSSQIHGVLKTNLQLLSLQKLGLLPSSVRKILQFDAPISQLRLHPNHSVTASTAATYIFLLQHMSNDVVEQSMNSLVEELVLVKRMLAGGCSHGDANNSNLDDHLLSKDEFLAIFKFDLKVLLSCACLGRVGRWPIQSDMAVPCLQRAEMIVSSIIEKLINFDSSTESCIEMQTSIFETLCRITSIELLSKCSVPKLEKINGVRMNGNDANHFHEKDIAEHLKKYSVLLAKALDVSSPFGVKLKALDWICSICEDVITMYENSKPNVNRCDELGYRNAVWMLVSSVLGAAADRELKVRSRVAIAIELLSRSRLMHPEHLYTVAGVVLQKLADPDADIRAKFVRLLSHVLPLTVFVCGLYDSEQVAAVVPGFCRVNWPDLHWRQVFSLKQLPQRLQFQQLVSVLSYISQRWKAPLSSWIQRFICHCRSSKDLNQQVEEAGFSGIGVWMDIESEEVILEKISSVNNLAGIWWAINEAARYCTASRLRTNLGGPTQSFAALERMLLDMAHVLQLDTEQNDGSLSIIGASGAHLLPMRLLLEFVEVLKKNVYNAYEGSSVLPTAPRQSSLFFRANKKVCEEWFSRICEPMMNAGLALQCHDATILYCTLRLKELKSSVASAMKDKSRSQAAEHPHSLKSRLGRDVLRIMRHMALALCKKHEPDALIGLQKWTLKAFSSLFLVEKQTLGSNELLGPLSWITGLVYQAEGQYEKAAAFFCHLLQMEECLSSLGADGVQFAIARILESYNAMSDWKALDSWLSELQALRARHAGKIYSGALTTAGNDINAIHALSHFDEGDLQAAWSSLDLTPKSSGELTLDPQLALQRSEQMLLQAMLYREEGKVEQVLHETQKAKSLLDEVFAVLPLDGMVEAAPHAIQLHCIFAVESNCKYGGNLDKLKQLDAIWNNLSQSLQFPISRVHQDCHSWLKVFRIYQKIHPTSPVTLQLCKGLISLARKQRNLELASRLKSYLRDHVHSCSDTRYQDVLISGLRYEEILLMYSENKFVDAFMNLWSYISPYMLSPEKIDSAACDSFLKAKACLKLSQWLRQDHPDLGLEKIMLGICDDLTATDGSKKSSMEQIISSGPSTRLVIEEIAGTAAKLSTRICPTMGKSWISYASWCFGHAKDDLSPSWETVLSSCSFSSVLDSEIVPERFKLTNDEISRVESVISDLFQERYGSDEIGEGEGKNLWVESVEDGGTLNLVKSLVHRVVNLIETAAGAPGAEDFGDHSLSGTLTSQLQKTLIVANFHMDQATLSSSLNILVEIWRSLRKRRVSLFGHAAHAFVQFLSYSSSKLSGGLSTSSACGSEIQKTGNLILRAVLYILHILLNFGAELKDILEPALSAAPLPPWQEVTPQLFARLSSHPEHVIRKQLESLLLMLAKLSPWSIVYPALVDVNAHKEEPSEELQCILDCLMKLYPGLVQDVKLMIYDLGNVTVLWEEQWVSTLLDLHGDVMRRINLLKEEAARIANNVTLTHSEKSRINAAKYSAMMAPIVVALERRLALVSRKPETPHEIWFQKEYIEKLRSAISTFKTPPASTSSLGDVWRPFDSIAASLASYQRKSSISMKEVAPQLACLASSDVPMPGLEKLVMSSESDRSQMSILCGIITIASFSEQVVILPTKTRPKKLIMLGSDGEKYTYLLKGREDLRLDARIMQLLQAVNNFLHASYDTRSRSIGIRYYSVTPLSGRAGLIQWVDNVISIYSVFKSWQQRGQLSQISVNGGGSAKNAVPPPVPRPSDMFYGKIIPALKEKGIRRVISRRDWPHEVKRKVLLDLMKETPRQLIHQELWCASEGFKAFSSKLKRYSGSLAAMSMVGHILGLGDRHLDNVLMDFFNGDVIHIDYNVCFDKGQRLKVPEIVPFRLTQMLEAALGLTGIEGTFRANCEMVLDVLRKNKDILLMLLEVFVWNPLVEWTRGDFNDDAALGGEERKGMELAVSLSLFASRVQEMRVPLQEHHDLLLASIPAIESALERFVDILNQYELVYAQFYHADQERSTLLLHETSAKSIVAEATSNSEKTRALYEIQAQEFAQAKAAITEKAQEATKWIEQHGRILDVLRSDAAPEMKVCIKMSGMEDLLSLTAAVSASSVPLTIVPEPTQAQCYDIDQEVGQIMAELDEGVSAAVTSLQVYSLALQRILPLNYLMTSPVHGWAHVLQLCVNSLSSDVLMRARRQGGELFAKDYGDGLLSVGHTHDDLSLKLEKYAIEIQNLEEEYAKLANSISLESESKAKDCLLSPFMKYTSGLTRKEELDSSIRPGQVSHDETGYANIHGEIDLKKEKVLSVLCAAVCSIYDEVKHKVVSIFDVSITSKGGNSEVLPKFGTLFSVLDEEIEKCILVVEFLNELHQLIGSEVTTLDKDVDLLGHISGRNWASVLKGTLLSCRELVVQMSDIVLPDVIKFIISFNSEVMDVFGALSCIRGSIETAVNQLVEVELEKASLAELEKSYFVKVGLITEQQLTLEEAAMKGRDHLSWEEAEELASQEEDCRAQLNQLQHTWNQKDMRASSLAQKEASAKNALVSSEMHFLSFFGLQEEIGRHDGRNRALLSVLAKPFFELDSLDKALCAYHRLDHSSTTDISCLAKFLRSGCQISDYIWKYKGILNGHSFFAWKIGIISRVLDSSINCVSSSYDQNLGLHQLVDVLKKKLAAQLEELVGKYLEERIVPALLVCLDKQIENLKPLIEGTKETGLDQVEKDIATVKRVQTMLEEYCNAHETVRAARSASSLMKRQVNDLKEAMGRTSLEIVQMEWMCDVTLTPLHKSKIVSQRFLETTDKFYPLVLNISRPKLLEGLQSAVSKIAGSIECLQTCEITSATAEGQLERAMSWACGGPTCNTTDSSFSKSSAIPPEFHDHLRRRRQLLWEAREKAADLMKICLFVLEFEASRDGILCSPGELSPLKVGGDGNTWKQNYLNALTRLDACFHSFSRAEQEWKLAQTNMEAASNDLFSATSKLCIASVNTQSASGELQSTLLQIRDRACEASVALSAFGRAMSTHTALTTECGPMLEEVLAITEGLHDVHNLGKEAASVHHSLMEYLSKSSAILLPLESVLSKDVATMTDAMAREKETQTEISPIHGQAVYQSYCLRTREALQNFKPLVFVLVASVKELYSLLTGLAQTASLHAGNLHKALEGQRDVQEASSQEIDLSVVDLITSAPENDNMDRDVSSSGSHGKGDENVAGVNLLSMQEREWVSPPDSIYDSGSGSDSTSSEAYLSNSFKSMSFSENHCHEISLSRQSESSDTEAKHVDVGSSSTDHSKSDGSPDVASPDTIGGLPNNDKTEEQLEKGDDAGLKEVEIDQTQKDQPPKKDGPRIARGKNAFAMSVLRRIEMKLDGKDISENRNVSVAEQVDYLLKQATSVDNLCNMYEGWTPWI